MVPRFIRILLAIEFLLALMAALTLWSQAGGQYHLDLIDWYWKLSLPVAFAIALTRMTTLWADTERSHRRGIAFWLLATLLIIGLAGAVTFYYHSNEPVDSDEATDQTTSVTTL